MADTTNAKTTIKLDENVWVVEFRVENETNEKNSQVHAEFEIVQQSGNFHAITESVKWSKALSYQYLRQWIRHVLLPVPKCHKSSRGP